MKHIFLFSSLFISCFSFSQILGGTAIDEGRKLLSPTNFTIESQYEGKIVYEIAIDRDGKVTSDRKIGEKSTLTATPPHIEAKKYLRSLMFTAGTNFPPHQHVTIQVNFKKKQP